MTYPRAVELGIKVKHHTSLFESKAKGAIQLNKLKRAMSQAGAQTAAAS